MQRDCTQITRAAWRALLTLLLCALCCVLLGCRERTAQRAAAAEAAPQRIVSLSPAATEALFAVGAGAQMVGRSRFCDAPREALALPSVGGYLDPNLEAILALRPELVVLSNGAAAARLSEQLRAQQIQLLAPPSDSWDDALALLRTLGTASGHAERGAEVAAALSQRVAQIEAELAELPEVRALLVLDAAPLVVAGPGSFIDEALRRARGRNVVQAGGAYPMLPEERLLALDPEVILDISPGEGSAPHVNPEAPVWRELRAVRSGRLVVLRDDAVVRPGPRLDQAVRALATALRPSAAQ